MQNTDISYIYAAYRGKVLSYIRSRVSSFADAEDLCEDVFEKIQSKLDSYDSSKSALSTWIYTVTRNRVIDFYRRTKPQGELEETLPDEGAVDDSLLSAETLDELAEGLSKLNDEMRRIIILRYYDNKPLTEIAEIMNLSYGVVKLRHSAALKQLKASMGGI